jgi:hypothetical protein
MNDPFFASSVKQREVVIVATCWAAVSPGLAIVRARQVFTILIIQETKTLQGWDNVCVIPSTALGATDASVNKKDLLFMRPTFYFKEEQYYILEVVSALGKK